MLAQRASIERYPPVLHQVEILRARGEVVVVDAPGKRDDRGIQTTPSVQRVRIPSADFGNRDTRLGRLRWVGHFANRFRQQLARIPDVAIGYEPEAAALLLCSNARQTMRIVHLHEIPDVALYAPSITSNVAIRYMLRTLNRADLVIVPDAHRAAYTAEVGKLSRRPYVVMNCPPLRSELPVSRLIPWLRERGHFSTQIVHYQGSVGPDHALEQIIASMRYWPSDAIFVIVGAASPSYRADLQSLANRDGMSPRMLFVGEVPYSLVLSYAVGATVGMSLLEPHNRNWEFAAGASNKRFEYAALGIPQVTNSGAGIYETFAIPGIASVVDVGSVEAIGKAVERLLLNPSLSAHMGERARSLHLREYNYEHQFAPIVARIQEWSSSHAMSRP